MFENILWVFITLAVGAVCGVTAQRLKIPSGGLAGAMVGVIALNLITGKAYMPVEARLICQIISGTMIGCQISRKDIWEFRKILLSTSLLIIGMFILNLCAGFGLYAYGMDLTTALFSATPGGVTDMTLIADELGADTSYVSILQLTRLIGVLLIFPPLLKWFYKKGWISSSPEFTPQAKEPKPTSSTAQRERYLRLLCSVVVSVAGGMLAASLRIPAGGMIGSLLFCATFNVISQKGYFPVSVRPAVRIAAGVFVGTRMQVSIDFLISCMVPILILLAGMVSFSLLIAYLMHKTTGLDLGICLFASAPAGMQEMALVSQELGVDTPKVAVMHLFRIAVVIMLFPLLLSFLLHVIE